MGNTFSCSWTTINDFVKYAATQIPNSHHRKVLNFNVKQQLIHNTIGSLKTLFRNNLSRILSLKLQIIFNSDATEVKHASQIIASAMLGASGEKEEEDDLEDEEKGFDGLIQKLGRIKQLSEEFVASIKGLQSIQRIRELYLPSYLKPLVDSWGKDLKSAGLECAPLIWRLMAEVNAKDFVQHLYPQPKNSGRFAFTLILCRYFGITTTMLAGIFTDYINNRSDVELPELPASCRSQTGKIVTGDNTWTSKPDVLWQVILPKVGGKRNFLHFMQYDGYCIKIEVAKLNSSTASSHPTGFNSRSWRTYRDHNEEVCYNFTIQVSLGDIVGDFLVDKTTLGPSSIAGFKGMVNIQSAINTAEIKTGEFEAEKLFNHRLIVSMDPGLANVVGCTFSYGEIRDGSYQGNFMKKVFSARHCSRFTGLNDFIHETNSGLDNLQQSIRDLSQSHGRTMDLRSYEDFIYTFNTAGRNLREQSAAPETRKKLFKLSKKKQRFWSNFVNFIFAIKDRLAPHSTKAPVILFGGGTFGNVKGHRAGNYAWLKQYLSRFFTVFIINEYRTSQCCPKCFSQLKMFSPRKGVRVKYCESCPGRGQVPGKREGVFVVNRDVGAAMNFVAITIHLLHGTRPPEFCARRDND